MKLPTNGSGASVTNSSSDPIAAASVEPRYGNGLAIAQDLMTHSADDRSALQIAMGRYDIVEGVGAVWARR
jgi:hypothetical protein